MKKQKFLRTLNVLRNFCFYKEQGYKEELKRVISLNEEQLDNFYVTADCEEGNLYLFAIQGDTVKSINISEYDGKIDFENFNKGKVKLLVSNDKARNASIEMKWD